MGLEDLERLDAQFGGVAPARGGGEFTPIPEGTKVKLTIRKQVPALVGGKQTPVCKLTCEVVEPAEYARKRIWHDLWLTEANAQYLKRDLITLGWPGLLPDGKPVAGYKVSSLMRQDDTSLMGLGAEVTVGVETYDHTDPQSGEVAPRVKNTIKFFNAKYTAPAQAPAAKPPGAPAAAGPADPVPGEDESIPF